MLAIRLSRVGKKKQPLFRIILCEKQKDPWGKYLENLGTYNPQTKEQILNIDRIKYWLSKGAQPSDTLWNMFVTKGLVEGKKRTVTKISDTRKTKMADAKKKVEDEAAAKAVSEQAKAEAAPVEEVKTEAAPVEEIKAE